MYTIFIFSLMQFHGNTCFQKKNEQDWIGFITEPTICITSDDYRLSKKLARRPSFLGVQPIVNRVPLVDLDSR